ACGLTSRRETVNFGCTLGYDLVFLQSCHFIAKEFTQYICC
ncbi:unnamed protein product, partial [Rotaria sp. Silwood2]